MFPVNSGIIMQSAVHQINVYFWHDLVEYIGLVPAALLNADCCHHGQPHSAVQHSIELAASKYY